MLVSSIALCVEVNTYQISVTVQNYTVSTLISRSGFIYSILENQLVSFNPSNV